MVSSLRRSVIPMVAAQMIATMVGTLAACGGDEDDGVRVPVTVMTRNLYLGGDFTNLVNPLPTSPADIPPRAATLWTSILATDFPARAKLLADEIATSGAHLVALQEVELYRTQTPSNFDFQAPVKDATNVELDFLAILQTELAARGAAYRVAGELVLADVELPAALPSGMIDVRLTDRDVILARADVATADLRQAPFVKYAALPLPGSKLIIEVSRGRAAVSATVAGATFWFANSHLEVGGPLAAFQESQAVELTSFLATLPGQVVLAGDFNSPAAPRAGTAGTKSYGELVRTFREVWPQVKPGDPGNTCCSDLAAPTFMADERIDLVLTRGPVRTDAATITGTDPAKRTAGGLFASDHAGVVATVGVKP